MRESRLLVSSLSAAILQESRSEREESVTGLTEVPCG